MRGSWLVSLAVGCTAAAQDAVSPETPPDVATTAAQRPQSFKLGLLWENDADYFAFFDSEDADYTNGLRIDLSWTPEFGQRWAEWMPLSRQFTDMRSAVGLAIGQNMYSPDAIDDPDPVPDEHPWGAWLYVGGYLQRADATRLDTLEVDVGVTGEWAAGEPAQKSIHRVLESPDPKGWDNQNDSEFGINVSLQRTWKFGRGARHGWRAELLPYAGGTLGTIYTNATAGATARFGWNIGEDFGQPRIGWLGDQSAAAPAGWGFSVFGRLGGRLVAHNTFLDGSLFSDGQSVETIPLVGEAQLGASLRVCKGFELYYSQTWWTEEFESQGHGEHFGSWGFRVEWEY